MDISLLDLIERIHREGIDPIESSYFDLNQKYVSNLLSWYYGTDSPSSKKELTDALLFLTWAYCEAQAFYFWPSDYREREINRLISKFNISKEKIFDLYENKEQAFKRKKPIFISFEGIDGSGKTSYLKYIEEKLIEKGGKVICFSFPVYSSFVGKEIGIFLSGSNLVDATTVDPKSMSLWYASDRWNALNKIVLTDYDYVFFNRYTLSSVVYQSLRQEPNDPTFTDWVFSLEHKFFSIPIPDLYLIFDITPELAKKNITQKGNREYIGEKSDVYEKDDLYLLKARDLYRTIKMPGSKTKIINVIENNELLSINKVGEAILKELENGIL